MMANFWTGPRPLSDILFRTSATLGVLVGGAALPYKIWRDLMADKWTFKLDDLIYLNPCQDWVYAMYQSMVCSLARMRVSENVLQNVVKQC